MSRLDRHPTDRESRHRGTARIVGALAVLAGMTLFAAGPVAAAPAVAGPRLSDVDLSVKPAKNLPATDAEITVRGSGYDSGDQLWVAVCQDDGAAPASFAHCLGGAIPSDNATTSWAVITKDGKAPYAGPVAEKWRRGGSFEVALQIAVAVGQDADCVSNPCSVYTRSSDDGDRSQDARIPVRFTFDNSSSTGGSASSTEVIGAVPTTVAPDSVQATEAPVGSDQVVVFSGFTPGEVVDAALYSEPIPLPPVQADRTGTVTIEFTVPEDLPPGTHLVQAIGRQSARVGVAQFEVVAAAATSGTETTDATATETTPTSTASATASESAAPAPTTSSAGSTATTPVTTAETTSEAVGAAVPSDPPGGAARLIWLWVVLGALIVIGGAAAIVVMLRHRREVDAGYGDLPPAQPVDEVVAAPSWQAVADSSPETEPWQPVRDPGSVADDAGPATEQWSPFGESGSVAADAGPATEQWSPFGESGSVADDAGPATEQWRPVFDDGDQPGAGRHRSS
jgi:hypothetical protein